MTTNKKAYPSDPWRNTQSIHSIDRWLDSFQQVLNLQGEKGRLQAVAMVTQDWDTTERDDFINWMRYYEGLNHLKYKKAQMMLENGYYIPGGGKPDNLTPNPSVISTIPGVKGAPKELPPVVSPEIAAMDPNKEKLAAHKKKLISRLDSLEKLLRSDVSTEFAGAEISNFIRTIHDLKVNFYNLKLANLSSYDDLVYQKSNSLASKGFVKSASMLLKHAQLAPAPPTPASTNVDNATPANLSQGTPMAAPTQEETPVDLANSGPPEPEKATNKFLKNMSGGTITDVDENKSDDVELELESEDDDLDLDELDSDDEEMLTVVAQAEPISPPTPLPEEETPLPEPAPVAETPDQAVAPVPGKEDSVVEVNQNIEDIDDMIEQAFGKVTVEMIIAKLEEVSKIFKTKEIPRQLSIIDFMLDTLGMATFFPQLSEASGKAIESSNYISSRIDNVLSHLRGVIKGNGIDLVNGEGNAQVEAIKDRLQERQNKDEAKKEQKEQESEKETPVMEIEQPEVTPDVQTPALAPAVTPPVPAVR